MNINFKQWREVVGEVKPITLDEAAVLLGKSRRMVEYYEAGRDIPRDVMLLMAAYSEGFRPNRVLLRKCA